MNGRKSISVILLLLISANMAFAQRSESEQTFGDRISQMGQDAINFAAGSAIWLHFVASHYGPFARGENPTLGNDKIILSAFKSNQKEAEEFFYDGINLGGKVLSAIAQCESAKEAYEQAYGTGICEKIKVYAPGYHNFETKLWESVVKVGIPVAAVGSVVALGTGIVLCKKLKRD